MPNYNQAQFPRHLEILVTNGQLAEVQAIIGPIGYDAAALEAGQTLLQSWLELANGAKVLLATQMQATQNSQATCQAARRARLAIQQADPGNQARLEELLGL